MSAIRLRKFSTSSTKSQPSPPPSPTLTTSTDLTHPPSYTTVSDSTPQTKPDYTTIDPPSSHFRNFSLSNAGIGNLTLSLPTQSSTTKPQPLFYITNSSFSPSKPSVTLSSLSKTGPVLGIVKLNHWGPENTFGLGDPFSSQEVYYERLTKVSKWSHGTYEFDWGGRTYVWQRTKAPFFRDQPDLELREKVESLDPNFAAGEGEVLAVYKGYRGLFSGARGTFWLRKGGLAGLEDVEGYGVHDFEREEKDFSKWELVALLTSLGIIEQARRTARARRRSCGGAC